MRALIAEDEGHLSLQLAAALAEAGYAVDRAGDGERAEFLGQTESYDVVVLDLGLPRLDGLAVLRRWRDAGLTMPVLVLTARGSWYQEGPGDRRRRRRLPVQTVPNGGTARPAPRAHSTLAPIAVIGNARRRPRRRLQNRSGDNQC